MGAVDRSFERVVAAAKFVGAHDFIQRLPEGYETQLSERGGGLSAGQRQLLSIARAVIRNPRLLVLDEATSGLDAATEEALLVNLRRASRGRTIVIVTHRLAALAIADRVVLPGRRPYRAGRQARPDRGMDAGAAAAIARSPAASVTGLTAMLRRLRAGTDRYAEFLPDAEGLIERGHSPVAGLLILAVAAIFGGLIGWAGLTEVEQVVRADGQVEPAGRVKLVNHPDGGRIAEIHVAEGEQVAAGQPLVTFDPELIQTQLAELTGRWRSRAPRRPGSRPRRPASRRCSMTSCCRDRPAMVRRAAGAARDAGRPAHASQRRTLMQAAERRTQRVASIAAELDPLAQQPGAARRAARRGAGAWRRRASTRACVWSRSSAS